MSEINEFRWRDGERTILFGDAAFDDASRLLAERDWAGKPLLTTERALGEAPDGLRDGAETVHLVPPGPVNEVAAGLFDAVHGADLVAYGGGRVIDAAKAIAAVRGGRVAAVPTTLSGAEMTAIHRLPDGQDAPRKIRPELVIAGPAAMTGLPEGELRASAMNALAHGADSLYTPEANPAARLTALEGARLIASALDGSIGREDMPSLALGSLLCGHALDSAHFSLHHVICQSLVRTLGTPHAGTNAAILPRAVEALAARAPREISDLAAALGAGDGEIGARIEELSGGRRGLGELGAERDSIDLALDAIVARPELADTPDPPGREELRRIVESAW